MIDQFYSFPSSWKRLRLGPLGPYIDAFARGLSERGYAKPTAGHKIRAVAGLSRWLERRQRGVEDLENRSCRSFSGTGAATVSPSVKRRRPYEPSSAICAIPASSLPCAPGREESPLHVIEQRFAQYLTQERGLAKPTIDNYLPIARTFPSERFGSKPITLDEITPRDIAGFIEHHAKMVSPRRAQLITTALRGFFRFLHE
ncbi:MAG: site-specific integrase [Syntrophorhabdales bacterium]|jgi:hypothetical protein